MPWRGDAIRITGGDGRRSAHALVRGHILARAPQAGGEVAGGGRSTTA